ncbi:MAG: ribosome assembly cofactor RimP [Ruminiclostridium sp.]|nr:ribosome assembly cofactor RimP [Ruminiclostridium sp.]
MAKEKGGKRNQAEYVEKQVLDAVTPIIDRYGYELWDVIFEKEGAMWSLKILFDNEDGGINDTQCEEITGPLNEAVDKLPCLELIDILEVGSPGLDRVLRKPFHFEKMAGQPIKVTAKDENGKTVYYSGELLSYDGNTGDFILHSEEGDLPFNAAKCKRIALNL